MIHFVIALLPEARFLIHALNLKQVKEAPYPIYAKDSYRLVLSGMGEFNAALAVTTLYHHFEAQDQDLWLNVGLAGHPTLELGAGAFASKISHAHHLKSFYPTFLKAPENRFPLVTQTKPNEKYIKETLFDMEAYGFYFAASQYATTERIHSYKVISDNRNNPLLSFDPKKAESLMDKHLDPLLIFIEELIRYLPKPLEEEPAHLLLKRYSFSQTEALWIKKHVPILTHLDPSFSLSDLLDQCIEAKSLLALLKKRLQEVPL